MPNNIHVRAHKAVELLTNVAQSIREQEAGSLEGHAYIKITDDGGAKKLEATKGAGEKVSFRTITSIFQQLMEDKSLTLAQKRDAIRAYETIMNKYRSKEVGFIAKVIFKAHKAKEKHVHTAENLLISHKKSISDQHDTLVYGLSEILQKLDSKNRTREHIQSKETPEQLQSDKTRERIRSLHSYITNLHNLRDEKKVAHQKFLNDKTKSSPPPPPTPLQKSNYHIAMKEAENLINLYDKYEDDIQKLNTFEIASKRNISDPRTAKAAESYIKKLKDSLDKYFNLSVQGKLTSAQKKLHEKALRDVLQTLVKHHDALHSLAKIGDALKNDPVAKKEAIRLEESINMYYANEGKLSPAQRSSYQHSLKEAENWIDQQQKAPIIHLKKYLPQHREKPAVTHPVKKQEPQKNQFATDYDYTARNEAYAIRNQRPHLVKGLKEKIDPANGLFKLSFEDAIKKDRKKLNDVMVSLRDYLNNNKNEAVPKEELDRIKDCQKKLNAFYDLPVGSESEEVHRRRAFLAIVKVNEILDKYGPDGQHL